MVETVITVERTTTTTGPPGPAAGDNGDFWGAIRINADYYRTAPGIIKIVQLILGIICMACASPAQAAATSFFLFVVVVSFIITILLSAAYYLGIREALNVAVNWIFSELLTTFVLTVLYFIAFVAQLAKWADSNSIGHASNTAAGVFGLFNFLAYAAGTYFLFLAHRSGATH